MLADHDIEYERRDYFKEPFSSGELRALLNEIDMTPTDLLSKRSKAHKELGLAERAVSDDELIELIPDNPTLIRRPIVVRSDGEVVVGFNEKMIKALIEN